MGTTSTENHSGNRTYVAETIADFGTDPILVEPGATANTVKPLTATVANRFAIYQQKLNNGAGDSGDLNCRLLNAGGTARLKTSGAISYGDTVSAASGGTVVTGAAATVGIYLGPDVASGAIIEVVLAH